MSEFVIGIDMAIFMVVIGYVIIRCTSKICDKLDTVAVGLSVIKELPFAQEWIPVSERLPEDDVEVFVYLFDQLSPYIAWISNCHWYTEDFEVEKENEPMAWMPLPKPYQEESV